MNHQNSMYYLLIQNTCRLHNNQILSHYIEDTTEVICVYCAFNKFKSNPSLKIKEINEKCKEIVNELDSILNENQNYILILKNTIDRIRDNKINEEKKINNYFDSLFKFLEDKKNEYLSVIDDIFFNNTDIITDKLDKFSAKMEDAEYLKGAINLVKENYTHLNEVLYKFNKFKKEVSSFVFNIEVQEYTFINENFNNVYKLLNSSNIEVKSIIVQFDNTNNNYSPVNLIKTSPIKKENDGFSSIKNNIPKYNIYSLENQTNYNLIKNIKTNPDIPQRPYTLSSDNKNYNRPIVYKINNENGYKHDKIIDMNDIKTINLK